MTSADMEEVSRVMREIEGAEKKASNLEGQIEAELSRIGGDVSLAEAQVKELEQLLTLKDQELDATYGELLEAYYQSDTDQQDTEGS